MTTNEQEAKRWNDAGAVGVTAESVAASRKKADEMLEYDVTVRKSGFSKDRTDLLFTLEEVKNHIGLTVNVSPKSKTKFHADLAKMIRHESEREIERQESKNSAATRTSQSA